jgi:hypothetical protein
MKTNFLQVFYRFTKMVRIFQAILDEESWAVLYFLFLNSNERIHFIWVKMLISGFVTPKGNSDRAGCVSSVSDEFSLVYRFVFCFDILLLQSDTKVTEQMLASPTAVTCWSQR